MSRDLSGLQKVVYKGQRQSSHSLVMARTKHTDRKSGKSPYQRATFGWTCAWSDCRRRFRYRPELLRHMNNDHRRSSSQEKGARSERPSETATSAGVAAVGPVELVELTRESVHGSLLSPIPTASWAAPVATGDRPLTLAERARMRASSTSHQRQPSEHGERRRSSSTDRESSRRTEETTTSRRSEKRPSTATVGSVARASATVTSATAGGQPAERAIASISRRTDEGLESSGRAVTATTTARDNVNRSAPLQRISDQRRDASAQAIAPSIRSTGVQTLSSADADVEESSSDADSTTPGASWPEWSAPSSADVWAMVQAMPSAGSIEIATAARRRYRMRRATARIVRQRAATLLYGRRATMAEVRDLLPVTGLDGNTALATIHRLVDWLRRDQERPASLPFD